jgi:anti-sigma B factor antagonist
MPDNEFSASVRNQGGVPVIDMTGDVNAFAEAALNAAFAQARHTNPSTVLLNFRDVTYMNSTGIALVVALLAQARKVRMQLLVCGLSDHYRHIFDITRLADFMSIYEDEPTAIATATARPVAET